MPGVFANTPFDNGKPGKQDPNNPFFQAGQPPLYMELTPDAGQLTGIQLWTGSLGGPGEVSSFTDPRWGPNTSKEHIWAYKSQVLAQQAYLCALLAQDLENTVADGINRPKWAQQIAAALPAIQASATATTTVCDFVTASNPQ